MTYHVRSPRTPRVMSVTGASRRIALAQALDAEITAKRSGDEHAAILLLMMLQNRGDDAGKREARPVQSVDEARLSTIGRFVPNICAPSLEISEVAARGNLEPLPYPRRKDLQVVGVRARESCVTGCEPHNAIWKLQQLENLFRVAG